MILVDTNVLSELSRRTPDPAVLRWAAEQPLPLAVSAVTVEEIEFGLAHRSVPRVEAWFKGFLAESCEVLVVDGAIARRAGHLRGTLRRHGSQRTQADMLIAATAQEHGLALATRNVADFDGCGIPVVNPFAQPAADEALVRRSAPPPPNRQG